MHIGDKVRLIHGHEQGVIINFLPNNLVEVEIDDGFVIPVLRKEIAVVAKEEADHFEAPATSKKDDKLQPKEIVGVKGLYLAFIPFNDQEVGLHLINNTDYTLLFSLSEVKDQKAYGAAEGKLNGRSFIKSKNYLLKEFDQWPSFLLQIIFHRIGYFEIRPPLTKNLKLRTTSFFKKMTKTPVIGKDGYLIQIDENQPVKVDPEMLRETLLSPHTQEPAATTEKPVREVDLHIEKILPEHAGMSNSEILNIQLNTFRQALDKAIVAGLDEITFIHGVGNGILKQAIQKEASQNKNIRFFKDAMKEKFGYGATLIRIK